MSVHYKFKSNLDHDTVTFDGLNISVADLKKSIMHQKKIGKSSDFDLQITNAQTKEVYDNDEMLVPKNTSVIVARVPVQGGSKKNWNEKPDLPLPIDDDDLGRIRYDRIAKSADLVNANTSEEDKVKAMITQSSQEYDPSKYVKSRNMTGPLPPCYTCFRCGKQGHWIKNCPTNNPDIKRSTGIPRSFMVPVDGPEHKGALLTSSGDYAVPLIDHQAYKEVKKEKPPFVPQDEPVIEPEAEIPEELLCMVCKDLLQDAVLIPCCGNSFCDECVRTVLLESDNHECPVCHETDVSPNTLIPNRFLRTAVLNYKNETGYTRVKRAAFVKSPPSPERVNSPQPSPDSTFESQSHTDSTAITQLETVDKEDKKTASDVPAAPVGASKPDDESSSAAGVRTPENATPKANTEDESEDVQPGTPLADEPIDHHLPIQIIGQEHYNPDRYHHGQKYSRNHRDDYRRRYSDESHEPQPISTIGTITNTREKFFNQRPPQFRQPFSNQRTRSDNRSEIFSHEREDYHRRYDNRHGDRGSRRTHDYDRPRDSRYHQSSTQEYPAPEHEHADYAVPSHEEDSSRRHQDRYRSPPRPVLLPPPVPATVYAPPVVPVIPPPHPHMLPTPQVFPPQPPPPGASPVNAAQPPPPGVGPLLPVSADAGTVFKSHSYESEDPLKEAAKLKERSIDDRMEEFQRKLDKQDRKYARGSRSRSRSAERHRSRSLSRSRSFSSSKSWTRSVSRSSTRTTRSRSRTPFSSRSRTRSYTPSRSRSWSKKRSYTRSRSRTRTGSRSRSRSRNEIRIRRRIVSRERVRSPRHRTRSRSFSPKRFRVPPHRSGPYSSKHSYNQPTLQFGGGSSYQPQFGPPQAILPIPVMRPPTFPPHHLPTMHPVPSIHPVNSRSIEQYSIDRPHKYPPYGDQYPVYDMYPPKYEDQKYEREQRIGDHRSVRYDKRPEYQRHQEEVGHRIPGWVGDRPRDYKPRYRNTRDQRKEIRELPQIPESEMLKLQTKEDAVEETMKRKEERVVSKHKKHHHHHKSKDSKKDKTGSGAKLSEPTKIVVKEEVFTEQEKSASVEEEKKSAKSTEKGKDKKHKHKKHKAADHLVKKKRSTKKQKVEAVSGTDCDVPVKTKIKKKKVKVKAPEVVKTEPISPKKEKLETAFVPSEPKVEIKEAVVVENLTEIQVKKEPIEEQDVLDIFADEPESELVDLKPEVAVEGDSADLENNVSEDLNVEEEIEESGNSEEEEVAEESIEEENVLRVDMPGISKWEREESEDEYSASIPQRRGSVVVAKEEKGSISSDIISRAENALIAKQFKPRIESKGASDSKDSSEDSTPERVAVKVKETPEIKSVVNKEPIKPDTLKVTISNTKEKRSVYTKKEDSRKPKSESVLSKRSGGDRSSRYHEEQSLHRSVAVYPVREDDRFRSQRVGGSDSRERKRSPQRELVVGKSFSREIRDNGRRSEREIDIREQEILRREERRHRFEDIRINTSSSRDRSDRRRIVEPAPQSRIRRPQEREPIRSFNKRSRSRSSESGASYVSIKRKNDRKHLEPAESRHRPSSDKTRVEQRESTRMKHSPIKPPGTSSVYAKPVRRDYQEELKFEPDYDEFSDLEEKTQETKEKAKRKASSPEGSRKIVKISKTSRAEASVNRTDKTNVASSVSSSAVSESDSSDSDEPKESKGKSSESDHKQKHKKSKHKKHKKHKHKHKKKKSHKSKQKD